MKFMENKQQIAVEWLIEQLFTYGLVDKNIHPDNVIFHKAKEIEKEKIIKAYEAGWVNGDLKMAPRFGSEYFDQNYNK